MPSTPCDPLHLFNIDEADLFQAGVGAAGSECWGIARILVGAASNGRTWKYRTGTYPGAVGTTVGIFIFEGAEELDWAGPYEVLASWAQLWPQDRVHVITLTMSGEPIRCAKGLRVIPDHAWDTAPPLDVLIYPGGIGTRAHLQDDAVLSWVRKMADHKVLMTSVCTGSLVYAAAGLLDRRPATTHWASLELLGSLGQDIDLRAEERFVDDQEVITAGGVSAGIDMALHLVARLHSVDRAREVRRAIQYDPQPPV